jgi:hypothetical protein
VCATPSTHRESAPGQTGASPPTRSLDAASVAIPGPIVATGSRPR